MMFSLIYIPPPVDMTHSSGPASLRSAYRLDGCGQSSGLGWKFSPDAVFRLRVGNFDCLHTLFKNE